MFTIFNNCIFETVNDSTWIRIHIGDILVKFMKVDDIEHFEILKKEDNNKFDIMLRFKNDDNQVYYQTTTLEIANEFANLLTGLKTNFSIK